MIRVRGDCAAAVAQALQVQGLARLEDHVRGVVGSRAIDPQADRRAGRLQLHGRADARGQAHVRTRAVADTGAGLAETTDLLGIEVDAVGQPGARAEPADAVQVVHGAQAEALQAEVFLVEGLRQVGVQAYVVARRQFGAGAHDLRSHRERRAGRQGDLHPGAFAALVVASDQSLAVGEDGLGLLHRLLRRQAAVLLAEAHRAAGEHGAHAQFLDHPDLHVDGLFEAAGEQVVVVGGSGAARQQQLGQRHLGGQFELLRGQPRPDRVEGLQPGEQRLVDHRRPGAGKGLVEVVMGVDESRQDHVPAGVELAGAGLRGLLAGAEQLDDAAVFDDQAAGGVETVSGEDGEGVANPGAGHVRTFVGSAGRRERCRPSVDESQLSVHPVC